MNVRQIRLAGVLMITAAVIANVCFLFLGSLFSYPDVLEDPTRSILRSFHDDAGSIALLFTLLALASALMIPIAVLCRQLVAGDRPALRRTMVITGVAAGIVQVVGLMRWPLFVPHLADVVTNPASSAAARADAIDTFELLHTWLGGVVGETLGYAFTAAWSITIVTGIARRPGRWFAPLGYTSAVLVALGVLEQVGLPGAGLAVFVGYLAWSLWMIGFGIALVWRAGEMPAPQGTALVTA